MFAAVPRSPEPPKEVPQEERPPSALASALLNSTLVGRVIATPASPESTLRSTQQRDDDDDDDDDDADVDGELI